jgi:hypothetical protein
MLTSQMVHEYLQRVRFDVVAVATKTNYMTDPVAVDCIMMLADALLEMSHLMQTLVDQADDTPMPPELMKTEQ